MGKFTDEERRQLAYNMALYIIDEFKNNRKVTTRLVAKQFKVSNYTVSILMSDYLMNEYPNLFVQVYPIIKSNRSSIKDKRIQKRVLKEASLVLQGFKYSDIINYFKNNGYIYYDLTESIIHHDLTINLLLIDSELYEQVKKVLKQNSLNNLKQGNNEHEKQQRDINGRFK